MPGAVDSRRKEPTSIGTTGSIDAIVACTLPGEIALRYPDQAISYPDQAIARGSWTTPDTGSVPW